MKQIVLNTRAARGLETSINRRRRKTLKCRLGFHKWTALNDAPMSDVPSTYPPDKPLTYISPKRQCRCCGRKQWFVGPEVCGGKKPRWVDFSELYDFFITNEMTESAAQEFRETGFPNESGALVDACQGPGGVAGRTAPAADDGVSYPQIEDEPLKCDECGDTNLVEDEIEKGHYRCHCGILHKA